jgi:hypothetical protein
MVAAWLESLHADIVFGWCQLMTHKGASAAAILSLASGVGACTAAFRLIDAFFLRPLPVPNVGRLYALTYESLFATTGQISTDDRFDYPALRISIGAGRARLLQLMLLESALVAAAASIVGVALSWWAPPFLVSQLSPWYQPLQLTLPVDWRVTIFLVAVTFAVAMLFGLTPALRASSVTPTSALKGGDEPHGRRRLMHARVATQVAFCVLVLVVAGLFVSTFERMTNQPTGFATTRLLTTPRRAPQSCLPSSGDTPCNGWDRSRG